MEIKPRGIGDDSPETLVHVHWPDVSASFDIGGPLEPGVLVHFFGAKRDLRHHPVFESINTFHKRKATSWCDNTDADFLNWFRDACRAIHTGEVFA